MRISIYGYEIKPGDLYRGRRIVAVKHPEESRGRITVEYEDNSFELGGLGFFKPTDELEVEREIERL